MEARKNYLPLTKLEAPYSILSLICSWNFTCQAFIIISDKIEIYHEIFICTSANMILRCFAGLIVQNQNWQMRKWKLKEKQSITNEHDQGKKGQESKRLVVAWWNSGMRHVSMENSFLNTSALSRVHLSRLSLWCLLALAGIMNRWMYVRHFTCLYMLRSYF